MRIAPRLVPLTIILMACQPGQPAKGQADPAYRQQLLAHVAMDQAIRDTFVMELRATGQVTAEMVMRLHHVDSLNVNWLKPILARQGWPTRAEVDADGVEAAFLMVQHADHDTAFQAATLPMIEAAFHHGEVQGQDFALLTDRLAKARNRGQIYGTQTTVVNGHPRFDPIDDSINVDTRRASLGLPPLARYFEVLDSLYGVREAP